MSVRGLTWPCPVCHQRPNDVESEHPDAGDILVCSLCASMLLWDGANVRRHPPAHPDEPAEVSELRVRLLGERRRLRAAARVGGS